MKSRTLIYLDPADLEVLRSEARSQGISLAELMRRLVREHVKDSSPGEKPGTDAFMKLVGLGSSDRADISERHDAYIAEALKREHSR
ncbi:MAG TPA: CopG family transcriptional regulator [bacterium]|nr:CopG family transcriptional regulator [bacterium]